MFLIESYTLAVVFCIITMLCWGSWANTQKLAGPAWRFELFYWDYVIGVLLLAVIFAFTLGSRGDEGRPFLADVQQAESTYILSALLGGVIFNMANILLVAAIAIAGMAVAFPVGIGIALVLGVLINYLAAPVGNALLLFGGVVLVTVAILLNAAAYRKLTAQIQKVPTKGMVLSVVCGILMSLFYRFVAGSMATDFANPEPGLLTPYTAVFFFSVGVSGSNFIFNWILMKRPIEGPPLSASDYFRGSPRSHLMGWLGGIIWCIGMAFNIIASGPAGFAISYGLGQGATLVAALWGVFIWKEFREAPLGTRPLLGWMFICYLVGLSLLVLSRFY
ncbi:GRP family sugar transporter [soil metagenome]